MAELPERMILNYECQECDVTIPIVLRTEWAVIYTGGNGSPVRVNAVSCGFEDASAQRLRDHMATHAGNDDDSGHQHPTDDENPAEGAHGPEEGSEQ